MGGQVRGRGKGRAAARALLADAVAIPEAGAFSVVLELGPEQLAAQLLDLVSQLGGILEPELLGRGEHLLLELDDQPVDLLRLQPFDLGLAAAAPAGAVTASAAPTAAAIPVEILIARSLHRGTTPRAAPGRSQSW